MINVPFKVACSSRKEDQFVSLPKATFGMGDVYLKENGLLASLTSHLGKSRFWQPGLVQQRLL